MKKTITLLLSITASIYATGQGIPLDNTFGNHGKVSTSIGSYTGDEACSVTYQSDGKIIAAGESSVTSMYDRAGMVRYNSNGSVDSSFGTNGRIFLHFGTSDDNTSGRGVCIQKLSPTSPENVILAGYHNEPTGPANINTYLFLARYHPNGTPDLSFGTNGVVMLLNAAGFNMRIDTSGNIIIAGYGGSGYGFGVLKFKQDGALDSSFGNSGYAAGVDTTYRCDPLAMALQQDGKIITGGAVTTSLNYPNYDFGLMRYMPDGKIDSSFGTNGLVITSPDTNNAELYSIALQSDGKILAAGISDTGTGNQFVIIRYQTNGSIDSSFGMNGIVRTNFGSNQSWARSVLVQQDGKIFAAGYAAPAGGRPYEFAVARYLPNGTPDSSFGMNGKDTSNVESYCVANAAVILPNLKLVLAGWSYPIPPSDNTENFALMQYLSGLELGVVNLSIVNATLFYPNPVTETATLSYELSREEYASLKLYDMYGRHVQTFFENEKRSAGKNQQLLHFLPTIPGGNYILQLTGSRGSSSVKLCIKK